jgi:hypothetical protein
MFVNPVAVVLVLGATFALIGGDRSRSRSELRPARRDPRDGGMLLLVYARQGPRRRLGAAPHDRHARRCARAASGVAIASGATATRSPRFDLRINGLEFSAHQLIAFAGCRHVLLPPPAERPQLLRDRRAAYLPALRSNRRGASSRLIPRVGHDR